MLKYIILYFRYVSLLRQRSTTTTTTPEDTSVETTMRDNFEEPRSNTNTKVSDENFTTESSIISTILFNTIPFTEITTTTVNGPLSTTTKISEATQILTSSTENISDTKNITNVPISIAMNISNNIISTTASPILIDKGINYTSSTSKIPTSTITNVITSIYEVATERQRVRIKNIQNFLLEHKKSEPVTQTIAHTSTSPTTIENIIQVEEPTQKSILKGRFGGQVQFRPTLKKPIGTTEKSITKTEQIIETSTEKKIDNTTSEKKVDTTTEKRFRLNKYVNRFIRPDNHKNNNNTDNSSTTTDKIFVRPVTESTLESSTRQFNRFRLTTSSDINNSTSLTRKSLSKFRPNTSEIPLTSNADIQKSRFFRSRKPVYSTSTSTTTTEETTVKDLLNSEENMDNYHYITTPDMLTTLNFPTSNLEETSMNDEEFKPTEIDNIQSTMYSSNEITTIQPTTVKIAKIFRGSVRANNTFESNEKSRSPSLGRQNSRFLKEDKKLLFIRILPSHNGKSRNEFTTGQMKNITKSRGRIRAFDPLELVTQTDELTNDDRLKEVFKGSETNFRIQQSTTTESTEEV